MNTNLVLGHCWKEWRAQRGLLVAYSLLVWSCLALGLWLAPAYAWSDDGSGGRAWFDEGLGTHAVTWFFAAGVLGLLLFVAPGLVRTEFGTKDDQFVRRLPGALLPSFLGKLLFLLLAAAALPLLGLLLGELYVSARGFTWNGLFEWRWDGEVLFKWLRVVLCGSAMLLVPWVWAIGTWLPGGRMALGGTVLFVLLVGVGVFAVLRQSPNIEDGIAWQAWLWAVAPLGLIVAGVAWIRGRRGGGPLRSARIGVAAAVLGLVPPSVWFATEAWAYHHPDLARLAEFGVQGLSPEGRFALARGNTHQQWAHVTLRIDLETGQAEQVTGVSTFLFRGSAPHEGSKSTSQWWYECGSENDVTRRFDLVEGAWHECDRNEAARAVNWSRPRGADARERTCLRAPGDRRVWFEGDELCAEQPDGTVTRRPIAGVSRHLTRPAGHGFFTYGKDDALFDAAGNRLLRRSEINDNHAWVVRDQVVFQPSPGGTGKWVQRSDAGTSPCAALAGCSVLGLFDDEHLLATRVVRKKGEPPKLFLYRPAEDSVTALEVSASLPCLGLSVVSPLEQFGSLLVRDPAQGIWLYSWDNRSEVFLRIDAQTLAVTPVLPHRRGDGSSYRLLDWPDAHSVRVSQDEKILRFDLSTGERTVLFPRRP
jgi:hypothetical protein